MGERGKYIVLEGSDGTGKSSQAIRLTERLAVMGYDPLVVFNSETGRMEPIQEPGGTPEADKIRLRIKDKSIPRTPWTNVRWFTDARISIWNEAILPALEAGRPVITARNFISTITYQGYGEGVPVEDILALTREEVGEGYMQPDHVSILALQSEVVRRGRLEKRNGTADLDTFESMPEAFQLDMQSGYVRFASEHGIEITDADKAHEDVEAEIWAQLLNKGLFS